MPYSFAEYREALKLWLASSPKFNGYFISKLISERADFGHALEEETFFNAFKAIRTCYQQHGKNLSDEEFVNIKVSLGYFLFGDDIKNIEGLRQTEAEKRERERAEAAEAAAASAAAAAKQREQEEVERTRLEEEQQRCRQAKAAARAREAAEETRRAEAAERAKAARAAAAAAAGGAPASTKFFTSLGAAVSVAPQAEKRAGEEERRIRLIHNALSLQGDIPGVMPWMLDCMILEKMVDFFGFAYFEKISMFSDQQRLPALFQGVDSAARHLVYLRCALGVFAGGLAYCAQPSVDHGANKAVDVLSRWEIFKQQNYNLAWALATCYSVLAAQIICEQEQIVGLTRDSSEILQLLPQLAEYVRTQGPELQGCNGPQLPFLSALPGFGDVSLYYTLAALKVDQAEEFIKAQHSKSGPAAAPTPGFRGAH